MAIKTKDFPLTPASPWLRRAMQSCAFILAANWVMQGVRGMDAKELSFRTGLAVALTLALWPALAERFGPVPALAIAALLAHTFNYTANGQVWVCCRYCRWYGRDPARVDVWLANTIIRLRRLGWLEVALCIGSQGRGWGTASKRSDIDLRLVFPPGPLNYLRVNLLLLALRAEALVKAIPLDLYAYDGVGSLRRFKQNEPLLVILDRCGELHTAYPKRDLRAVR